MSRAGDIAETGPSIAELLRRRAQGEPSMQAVADPASSDQNRPAVAPLEQVRSVPVRRERPAATAPAARPVAAPARKGLLSRVGAMLSRGGDARTRQAAEAAPVASMPPVLHAAPLASPDMSIVSEPAAPASEADIMAGYFSRLPADTAGVAGGEPDAWPVHAAPGSAVVPPAMPVAAPSYRAPPVHLLPAAPVIPLPSAHPAAPWQPVGMPMPASAHFYWPVAPVVAQAPAAPPQMPWAGAAQPPPVVPQPSMQVVAPRVIPGNSAARAELAAEIEAVRERLRHFAEMVDRLREMRGAS